MNPNLVKEVLTSYLSRASVGKNQGIGAAASESGLEECV